MFNGEAWTQPIFLFLLSAFSEKFYNYAWSLITKISLDKCTQTHNEYWHFTDDFFWYFIYWVYFIPYVKYYHLNDFCFTSLIPFSILFVGFFYFENAHYFFKKIWEFHMCMQWSSITLTRTSPLQLSLNPSRHIILSNSSPPAPPLLFLFSFFFFNSVPLSPVSADCICIGVELPTGVQVTQPQPHP